MSNAWFVRHTKRLGIDDKDVEKLWEQNRIAVHFSGPNEIGFDTADPEDYKSKKPAHFAMTCMKALSVKGGYLWAEYRGHCDAKVGEIRPQEIILVTAQLAASSLSGKSSKPAILKTLQLDNVKHISPNDWVALRASKPRQRTISPWPGARNKLQLIVNGGEILTSWDLLSTAQQETVCSEFLRFHSIDGVPRLARLLLPPGRTLENIDIYGMADDGQRVYAQVTFSRGSQNKINKLKRYAGKGHHCVFFCDCEQVHSTDGISFVPTTIVHEWLQGQSHYAAVIRHD